MKVMRIFINGVPYGHLSSVIMRSRQDGGHSPDKWDYNSGFQMGTTCRKALWLLSWSVSVSFPGTSHLWEDMSYENVADQAVSTSAHSEPWIIYSKVFVLFERCTFLHFTTTWWNVFYIGFDVTDQHSVKVKKQSPPKKMYSRKYMQELKKLTDNL